MAKAKIWKLGTSANFYVDTFFDYTKKYSLKVDEEFEVKFNKKTKAVTFIFDEEGSIEQMERAKASQLIRVLLTLGIIKSDTTEFFDKDENIYNGETYRYVSPESEWVSNFVEMASQEVFIDSLDEEGNDNFRSIFPLHKDAFYSVIKTFSVYNDDSVLDYSNEDRKNYGYWNFEDEFKPHKEELERASERILFELGSVAKTVKDESKLKWFHKEIHNFEDAKDGRIDSQLWNLSNILKSKYNISIPIMQRKYVWDTNLVEKLLEDIMSIGDKKPFHYIGSIVYKEKENNFRILDGQQRLTTLFLILTAVYSIYLDEDINNNYKIEVPDYFKGLFPSGDEYSESALYLRFSRVSGNEDFKEFEKILQNKAPLRKEKRGNMSLNFMFSQAFIKNKMKTLKESEWQDALDTLFKNVVERTAFTVNKNQIESEYQIFEKLNTLSKPLNQIDLLKNHVLPYCKSEELDRNEAAVQQDFNDFIFKKFEKQNKVSEPSVKRFVNYYISMYSPEYFEDENFASLPIFDKLGYILEKKYKLKKESLSYAKFSSFIEDLGNEIDSFLSITERNEYIQKENMYYNFSDILSSFDKRYIYAPLIKRIFTIFEVDKSTTLEKIEDKLKINKVRDILFEIERYELFFQVVLYRGQSISHLIDNVIKEINKSSNNGVEIKKKRMREIFAAEEFMTNALITPTINTFIKKVSEDTIADKVSVLLLNRIKFNSLNGGIELTDSKFPDAQLSNPSREHIISQTINDIETRKQIFSSDDSEKAQDDKLKAYIDGEFNKEHRKTLNMIGNLLLIEKSDNSKIQNKSPQNKLKDYQKLHYLENDPVFSGWKNNNKSLADLESLLERREINFSDISVRSKDISKILQEIYK